MEDVRLDNWHADAVDRAVQRRRRCGGPIVADLFPVAQRTPGIGLGYNLGGIFSGGLAPFVTAWLIQLSDESLTVAWYG